MSYAHQQLPILKWYHMRTNTDAVYFIFKCRDFKRPYQRLHDNLILFLFMDWIIDGYWSFFITRHSNLLPLNNKSRLYVSWVCLPLIPSIILFSHIAYQLSLASTAKLSRGSHHTCHHVGSWSCTINSTTSVFSRSGPRGSVLGPVLFILYTTPLSSLTSDSFVGHRYADDNQLFISFVTSEFSIKMSHLQATVDLVSQWMSSNLVSLNLFKTEFLIIGIPAQLPKIFNPRLLLRHHYTNFLSTQSWCHLWCYTLYVRSHFLSF